ncbi:MAG: aminopeptidase P N-terminal domain-containing protein [Bacteroidales bacterium]|nr:aminopeptidase P N-terminal domain-containing protein [Bacteroidales bacterium]MCF8391329.1 aminopeptidase P N-terminal domain-containing protein [Bacteroidales bacterium]
MAPKHQKINKKLFIKNRFKLSRIILKGSCYFVFSNDEMPRNGDQYFPYRQNSDFFYLTGIEQEKSILMVKPDHPEKNLREVLFIIKPTPLMETWIGHKLSIEEARNISGIENIQYIENFENLRSGVIQSSDNVYLNIPEVQKFNPVIETMASRASKEIMNHFPLHNYKRLAPLLRDLRVVKEEEEIEEIKKACTITGNAFSRVLQYIHPGISEKELEAEISYEFIKANAGHAYLPIIGSGKNACILHYTENNQICKDGDLVLMDFGAEYNNYAADCTRTIPVNGKFSSRQAEVYDGLHEIFKMTIKLMEPGRKMTEVHTRVSEWMKKFHIDIGLYTKKDSEENKNIDPLWFKYYMHGTGHSLGLDVHDIYDKQSVFTPGMIFTCEPAIYIKEENLGIRIENDILITREGNIDLMKHIPSERKEIEKLMKRNG